jgi:hypothetical protein
MKKVSKMARRYQRFLDWTVRVTDEKVLISMTLFLIACEIWFRR